MQEVGTFQVAFPPSSCPTLRKEPWEMALSAQGCSPHASASSVGSGGAWRVRAVARTIGRGRAEWGGGGWVREGQ